MNVFCGYFTWLNGPNFEVIFIIPIFGVLFSQNLGIRPLGLSYRGLSPSVLALIFKKSHYALSWMNCCGHFTWSNGYLHNINIWGNFWSQFGYLPPPGYPYIGLLPIVLQLLLNKYLLALVWMYFCGYFVLSNGLNGIFLHNTYIWGRFWSYFGYLTPWGDLIWDFIGDIIKITAEMD